MKISVVTVCYNAEKELEETILSVLSQSHPDIEYIIIDGGSTDGTIDIIQRYSDNITYWISELDKGIYDAMNKGIAAATGDYINFMNAGDSFASNDAISKIVTTLKEQQPGFAYGDYYYKCSEGLELKKPLKVKDMWKRIISCHQAIFFANKGAEIFYNTNYRLAADFELCTRIHYRYQWPIAYIPEPICIYAGNGVSEHNPKNKTEIRKIAKQYIPWWKRESYLLFNNAYDDFAHWVHVTCGDKFFNTIAGIKNRIIGHKKNIKK